MIDVSVTETVNNFHRLLARVEGGETVRIRNHGRAVARMVRDVDFMSNRDVVALFSGYEAGDQDRAVADEIERNIRQMDAETAHALAH